MAWDDAVHGVEGPCGALLAWGATCSLVGAVLAVQDKRQARAGGRRVPERTLLALALLGGWPGLALAFVTVRHKTRKARFLLPFALLSLLSLAAFVAALDALGCGGLPILSGS